MPSTMQKLQPALRAYLTKLREDAYIDIKPGYVDTGASPNQTKPIETAQPRKPTPRNSRKEEEEAGITLVNAGDAALGRARAQARSSTLVLRAASLA